MDRHDVQALSERIDVLLDEVQRRAEPEITLTVEELVRAVLSLHGAALGQLLDLLSQDQVQQLVEDDLVAGPAPAARPAPGRRRDPDPARARLGPAVPGLPCRRHRLPRPRRRRRRTPAPAGQLRRLSRLDRDRPAHGRERRPGRRPRGRRGRCRRHGRDTAADPVDHPAVPQPTGTVGTSWTWPPLQARSEHLTVGGLDVLVANLAGTLFAYRNNCPVCSSALHHGELDDDRLTCPRCTAAYDVRLAGRALAPEGHRHRGLPLSPEGSGWKVAIPGVQPA